MIQDIGNEIFHNEFVRAAAEPADDDYLMAFGNRQVMAGLAPDGALMLPTIKEARQQMSTAPQYLFSIGEKRFWLWEEWKQADQPEGGSRLPVLDGFRLMPLKAARSVHPKDLCFAAETAYQLYGWYRDNCYCGRCGRRMHHSETERAMVCDCGNTVYPKISPAVIIGLVKDDSILVSRYAGREYRGHALLAGFCEFGESAEQTVKREVMEEVGLHVKDIRYYASQPWGFDSDLLLGFYCRLDGSDSIRLDENELAVAEFVKRSELGEENRDVSLTATMIMYFKEHPEAFAEGGIYGPGKDHAC